MMGQANTERAPPVFPRRFPAASIGRPRNVEV
jgi:hypothetical protein